MQEDPSPIIFYYYFDLSNSEYYCARLEERFRETGHTRPIEFRKWNCYEKEPGRDGDIYHFDGVVLSALAAKGYLHELPDVIPTEDLFPWTMERALFRKKAYGVPMMACCNALICRREDDRQVRNVLDLQESVAIPMRSFGIYYYLQALCNYQNREDSLRLVQHLIRLMGGQEEFERSLLSDYDGVGRFNRRECRYFMGFTESMRFFEKGDYVVCPANFSENETDQMPLFMIDYLALGIHPRGEKLLDCLDLMELSVDGEFIYDQCTEGGKLQYMLPVNRSVYPRLAEWDPVYRRFFEILSSDENSVFRYGPDFYEDFYRRNDEMLALLTKS